jgi:phosphatidylethanolamine/phosphatidyl-N-methylethanolamine N-methyltransferase
LPSDTVLFLKQLLHHPREISAAIPSSKRLASTMAAAVPDITGPIAELGPGTGRITQALLDRGAVPDRLSLFEINQSFADHLATKYPDVKIHNRPAQDMVDVGLCDLSAVVSGLPLLSIPEQIQNEIIRASFQVLAKDGVYVQFTYGPKLPIQPDIIASLNLKHQRHTVVLGNLPPAQVLIFSRSCHIAFSP